MANPADFSELERSRAAVAIACLEWLRCTGPEVPPALRPARTLLPRTIELPDDDAWSENSPSSPQPPHPLWDRWIDGSIEDRSIH